MPLAGFRAPKLDSERIATLTAGVTNFPFLTHPSTLGEEVTAKLLNTFTENSVESIYINHESLSCLELFSFPAGSGFPLPGKTPTAHERHQRPGKF